MPDQGLKSFRVGSYRRRINDWNQDAFVGYSSSVTAIAPHYPAYRGAHIFSVLQRPNDIRADISLQISTPD